MADDRRDADVEALAALAVILARVRCEAIHAQTNGGRCSNCISWARAIGAPAHLPRLADLLATAKRDALTEAAEAFATGEWADAFIAEPVEDDVSAVRAIERWLRERARTIGGGS